MMHLDALSKMNTGWLYEKGRFNTYQSDMYQIDTPIITADNGTKFGCILPTPVFTKHNIYSSVLTYVRSVRTHWLNNGVLYSTSSDAPSVTPTIEFFDISSKTYKPAHFEVIKFVSSPQYIDDENHQPYSAGLLCHCDDGSNESFLIDSAPYYIDSAFYDSHDPEYDIYLGGGFAVNPITGDNCIVLHFYRLYKGSVRGYSRNVDFFPCFYYPIEHSMRVPLGVADQDWGYSSDSFYNDERDLIWSTYGGSGYPEYTEVYGTYTPYGRRKYSRAQAPLHNTFSALVKAPSDFCSNGYVWYDSSAGTSEPDLQYNVDI